MTTFVLVLFSWVHGGYAMATVPGFTSEAACLVAASEFKKMRGLLGNAFCISGPPPGRAQ